MKRYFYFNVFFFIFCFFLSITSVSAKECTTEEFRELKALAKKIEVNYEFDDKNRYFNVKLYNLKEGLQIDFGYDKYIYTSKNKGIIKLSSNYLSGEKLELEVYASSKSNCEGEYLYTIKEQLPIYNVFYDRVECDGLETEKICRKWFDYTDISEEEFLEQIKKLKQVNTKKDENVFEIIFRYIIKFWYIPVAIILICAFVIILKHIKEEKNKKIDL